jgi:hypothetical protein
MGRAHAVAAVIVDTTGQNIELQTALNPAGDCKVERFGWAFAPGDKVMQIENDYDKEVYNGAIGYIEDVEPGPASSPSDFDGRTVTYRFGELDMLVPAYAATTHKSQGSEYPAGHRRTSRSGAQHRAHTTIAPAELRQCGCFGYHLSCGLLAGFFPSHDKLLDNVLELPGLFSDFEHRRNGSRITFHGIDDNAA